MKKMTNTIQKLFVIMLCALSLAACKSKRGKEVAHVKPDRITISGPLGLYLEVVDNDYEIVEDWGGNLNLKLKAKAAAPDSLLKGKTFQLRASLLDGSGMPISGTEDFEVDYIALDKVKSLLQSGSGEEVIIFKSLLGGYHADKDADKVKKFSVSSVLKDEKLESPSVSSGSSGIDDTATTGGAGSENWDKLLEDYEAYVDDYVKFYKKAMAGDENALAEYPSMMEKAITLQKSLEKAQGDNSLSVEQGTKMLKIQTKMLTAMSKK
jgi:hypothetical protein